MISVKSVERKQDKMKYTEETIKQLETAIQQGMSKSKACELVGIADMTYDRWMQKKEFAERMKKARAKKIAYLLSHIRLAGIGELTVECEKCGAKKEITIPTRQWQALAWILERTEGDEFVVKTKTEISGKDGQPFEHLIVVRHSESGDNGKDTKT